MVATRKTPPNILEEFAPGGVYNTAASREGLDFSSVVLGYVTQRRWLEREVGQRAGDKYVATNYTALFQDDPPPGMTPPFVSYRVSAYLMAVSKLAVGVALSEDDLRMLRAAWGRRAAENDYHDFDDDVKLFFQAELMRRNDMALVKKNDPKAAAAAVEKAAARKAEKPAPEPKTMAELNAIREEQIARFAAKNENLLAKLPWSDTKCRFHAGNSRSDTFDYIRGWLKPKKNPVDLETFHQNFVENRPEHLTDKTNDLFVVATHPDVFLVEDGKISLNPAPYETREREEQPTEEERAAAKAAKEAAKAEKKVAKATTAGAAVTPKVIQRGPVGGPKKPVLLQKKPAAVSATATA